MIKAFLKYLLFLCVLLLSGYHQLSAHTYKGSAFYSPVENTVGADVAILCPAQDKQAAVIGSSSSGTAKENHKKVVSTEYEKEEDELHAFKKFLESNSFVAAILYAFTAGFLFRYLAKGFAFSKHFSHFSSYRLHILLQVYRI